MSPEGLEAYLLSGAGNDFLALVEPATLPTSGTIRAWCRRGLSLGADGLFALDRTPGGARMRYWNADGGRAELCLNGSRCAAQLGFQLGWGHGDHLTLDTAAGSLEARRQGEHVVWVSLPDIVGVPAQRRLAIESGGSTRSYDCLHVEVGVPHLVVPWSTSLAEVPIAELAPLLRGHRELGSEGANVNFVHFAQPTFDIRSFERGIEGETLACGTGVVAATAAGVALGALSIPARAQTAGGFTLTVEGTVAAGRLSTAALSGDARLVARCSMLDGAQRLPPPTTWRR